MPSSCVKLCILQDCLFNCSYARNKLTYPTYSMILRAFRLKDELRYRFFQIDYNFSYIIFFSLPISRPRDGNSIPTTFEMASSEWNVQMCDKFVLLSLWLFSRMRERRLARTATGFIGCLVRMKDLITVISSARTENTCSARFTNRINSVDHRSSIIRVPLIHTFVYSLSFAHSVILLYGVSDNP